MQRSFRRQVSLAKIAARLVLPVPAVPETSIELPRKKPLPPSILSSDGIPEEIRCEETGALSISEVIGNTEMPSASIKNGYSLVPCKVPRYFIIRNKRVDI